MGRLLHAVSCSLPLATLLLLAFAGNLHADDLDPNALRNPPSDCDPEKQDCDCPPTESSVDNGCVQVTLALGRTSPLSDQRRVELKIFTASASPALSTPETLHVVMGYTFQHLGPVTTPGAAPSTVDFVRDNGGRIRFRFAAGSSLAIPDPGVHIDLPERVQMVDANGWATLTDPAYYDLYPGDGSVWRFLATDLTGELGKLVSYTDPRGRVLAPEDFGVDIVRAPNGLLRQVLAPSRLADIVTRGPAGYTVTVYPLADADAPAVVNGLYVPPAHAPTEVLTVDRGDDIDRLVVTLKKGGADALRYDYAFVNGEWTLVRPDGVVDQKEIYYSDDEQTAQMVKTVKDASGAVQRRTVDAFSFESWGYAKTNQVDGFGTATRTTSWTHVMSGPAKGRIAERRDSTGAVVQYAYDANARRISETRPALGEVVTTSYAPVDPADPALLNDVRPRTVIRKIDNIEVERTYYAYTTNRQEIVERAATQGAAYGHPSNLRTVTTWYPADLDDHAAGRLKSVRHEDGQLDLYAYSWVDSLWTETVTRVHELEPDPVPMKTTRRSTVQGRAGHRLAERTELMTAPGVWE
ncbi:MAG: hypothetical protein GX615_14050, partial [Lentisphaerae bacterium]|nr:hypothetical protein [Lentisphaerota bacterium]